MKLVDILARELTEWPQNSNDAIDYCVQSDKTTQVFFGRKHGEIFLSERAENTSGVRVTRAEWQAAVDALNQSELDAVLAKNEQLAAARAERIPVWNGEGLPPVGTVCEVLWNESRVEYLRTKVFGVNEHGQPIHRFDEGPKKYQYQADVLRTASGTQVFRPIRTAEQVAAEERENGIQEICATLGWLNIRSDGSAQEAAILYDAGYRKEPKPCGS